MIDANAYLGHFAFRPLRHNTGAGLVRLMDRFHIHRALVSSAASLTYRNPQAGNEELAAQVEAHRSRLIPLAVLNPTYADWQYDLQVCQEQFGMKGVRLFPHWHNYSLTDPRCRELVMAATERHMVIGLPVRIEDRRQGSWLVDIPDLENAEIIPLLRACPQARFVIENGRGFAGSPLGRRDSGLPANYLLDMGRINVEFENELGQLVANLGEDRLVFGTGMPFHYPGPALTRLQMLEAPAAAKHKISELNAAGWYQLPAGNA
jgi:predicted TIM-barrel fold metal-dependent hydrolase